MSVGDFYDMKTQAYYPKKGQQKLSTEPRE